ncbi:benzoate/H(+) symporter BenE family transporter [Sporosarcina limicola]|uniref:Benzoate membrane transport protein n=1 Tax=Sporosarcina limicola TaxID=34101 RepID=A0A927MGQ0_9BACL|nr:benzoate/H(+) symporter BenE family transporter [Sporosarcina limicola]MBE1554303.1 benzoate membrane transport protein [Sporosarcina limicola]
MTSKLKELQARDFMFPTIAALVSVIVNYGGTFVIVFQAAKVANLSPELTASWVCSLSIGVGITGIWLSYKYKEPIITAWSTPGVAFLASALLFTPYNEAIGAYIISAIGFIVLGLSGMFDRLITYIPPGIASGLLAGILLQFGIAAFGGAKVDPALVIVLFFTYIILKRLISRFAVVGILIAGLFYLIVLKKVDFQGIELSFATPILTVPEFTMTSLLGVALPLFIITLTGQYIPGMLILRSDGFKTSANPIVTITGLGSLLMAPFGSHAFNIAAITSAICTGPDAHEDKSKRYIAGIVCGVLYIMVGIFGVTLVTLFLILPPTFIATLAGLALLGTIGSSLSGALSDPKNRETALITFLATAANVTLLGIGGAFWGLVAGMLAHLIMNFRSFGKPKGYQNTL